MSVPGTTTRKVPPDQEQRDRIKSDLDSNILVEAAAGTGKTASMIDRMVGLVRTGKCASVAALVAVTFTRKAASELRTRFQARLEYDTARVKGRERERLAVALANIDQCFIGTIHSFCARLLRERPVEARVDLAFTEIEPEEDVRCRKQAWDEYSARLIAGDAPDVLGELTRLGMTIADLEQTFIRFADFPDVDEWPVPGPELELPPPDEYVKALHEYAGRMRDAGPLPADPPPASGGRRLVEEYMRLPGLIARSDLGDSAVLIAILSEFDAKPPSMSNDLKKAGHGAWCKEEQQAWKDFREDFAMPYLQAANLLRYRVSIAAMLSAREIYDELRRRQGKLNFQDLLMKSADLLRDKPHVRAYFAARFTHLLVDEFQDTDPIQAEVMLFLTASDPAQTDWKLCVPRPGALFVVGDPKQSIYRFRRADIVTYNEVKRIIRESGGAVLELSANFRATGDLIAWTNLAFTGAFPAEATDQSPVYVMLHEGRDVASDGDLHGPAMLSVQAELCKGEAGARALEYEADVIARTIRCAIDSGASVARAGDGAPGEATPSDFMIICYNKAQLSTYARKLQQYGVPHRVSGGTSLNEVRELTLLHLCLNAVVQPDNPVALVATLRSELFGVSDVALYALKKAGGRFNYRAPLPESLEARHAEVIGPAFERLVAYALLLQKMPAVSAIERIVADAGLMVLAASRDGGDVQAGSVAKALEILRSVQDEMPMTAQLVDYLGEIVQAEAESASFDGVSAVPSRDDVVQVMNLHKAKGLQAPVVFLAGPKTSSSKVIPSHIDRSSDRVRGYMAVTTKKGFATITHATPESWGDLQEQEKAFQDAETTRLVYVAVTRAESVLVVTQVDGGKGKSIWSSLAPWLAEAGLLPDPGMPVVEHESGVSVTPDSVRDAATGIDERLRAVEVPTFSVRAAKEYALSGDIDLTPTTLMSFGEPGPDTTARVPEGEHGVEWGGAVHQVLELAMKVENADLEACAIDALDEAGIDVSRTRDLVDTVAAVMSSEIWQRARQASSVMSEVAFELVADDGSPVPVLVRGSIDLAFREGDDWVIVDYKTDSVPADGDWTAIAETYAPQVKLYARAFEQCTGQKVKETALYFIRENRLVEV
ncbi:MAG: UvrD-helicase domain-containing protein [Candidatus Geothermincolia bacterium]